MQHLELRVPPLLQLASVALLIWLSSLRADITAVTLPATEAIAVMLILAGGAIALSGVIEFRQYKTTMDPRYPDNTETLVTSGIYQLSRNPMYLGFAVALLGWCYWHENLAGFIWLPLFVLYMNRFQIQAEEAFMKRKFGHAYQAYCVRVRRWI